MLLLSLLRIESAGGSAPRPEEARIADEEARVLDFLRQARLKSTGRTEGGINRPLRVRATLDGREVDAVFRAVDEARPRHRTRDGRLLMLRDSFRFEAAAYELSRLLGTGRVPPTVLRRFAGRPGSVQLWIHDVVTEGERRKLGHRPADPVRWERIRVEQRIFDRLIDNIDRNLGNLLVDLDTEEVWWIDHTRSFTSARDVVRLEGVTACPRHLWRPLRDTTEEEVRQRFAPFLQPGEIDALWARWVQLRSHLEALARGSDGGSVIYDDPAAAVADRAVASGPVAPAAAGRAGDSVEPPGRAPAGHVPP